MDSREDYYEILQVSRGAESEVIDAAYRRLSRKYHPDVDKSPSALKRMQQMNRAYEILSDPIKRADYDSRYRKSSDSEKSYKESARKHSNTKDDSTTRKKSKRILWVIPISMIILGLLIISINSNKEVSTSGITIPTVEPMHTIRNRQTGEVKQVPKSQLGNYISTPQSQAVRPSDRAVRLSTLLFLNAGNQRMELIKRYANGTDNLPLAINNLALMLDADPQKAAILEATLIDYMSRRTNILMDIEDKLNDIKSNLEP